jgi:HEAT repeat protein
MSSPEHVKKLLAQRDIRGLGREARNRNVSIRRLAVQALGELADPSSVEVLEQTALHDTDQFVQQRCVESLRRVGGTPEVVDSLTRLMFGPARNLRSLAEQALRTFSTEEAVIALALRERVARNQWNDLDRAGEAVIRPLSIFLGSDLFGTWPIARRNELLQHAVALGAVPPAGRRQALAASGLFISGVHTVGDLIKGLTHRNASVRASAAERLASAGLPWTARPMYRRFKREIRSDGHPDAAISLARAMFILGDSRGVDYYRAQISQPDSRAAAEAAHALTEIGQQETWEVLFWFVASPPPGSGFRNVPTILSVLEAAGARTVAGLKHLIHHEDVKARRLMVELIIRCGSLEAVSLLGTLALDADLETQHAALDALAQLNTKEAADQLTALIDDAPRNWVLRAMAMITDPTGPANIRRLEPTATTLQGLVLMEGKPCIGVSVQLLQAQKGNQDAFNWRAASARAETDAAGAFALTVFGIDPELPLQLKIGMPVASNRKGGESFLGEIKLFLGKANVIHAHLDQFFNRVLIEFRPTDEDQA